MKRSITIAVLAVFVLALGVSALAGTKLRTRKQDRVRDCADRIRLKKQDRARDCADQTRQRDRDQDRDPQQDGSGGCDCPNPDAPDADGDGIPNGLDDDYVPPRDGSCQ